MSRLAKKIKKYERHLLLGIVIILLASFSITGAMCRDRSGPTQEYGGSFVVQPPTKERASVSANDFLNWESRFVRRGARVLPFPSLAWRYALGAPYWPGAELATWSHVVAVETAKRAGYKVGEGTVGSTIKDLVRDRAIGGGLEYTPATYQEFLTKRYQGSGAEFQKTVQEILLADLFREPFVETARYLVSKDEAYAQWAKDGLRIDLKYVAASGEPFAAAVKAEEDARALLARQQDLLELLGMTARKVRDLQQTAEAYARSHDGVPAKDLAELGKAASGVNAKDAWKHEFLYEVKDGKPWFSSAGPDGAPGTADDVTPDVVHALETHAALREVADAVVKWRAAAKEWPASYAKLRERPATDTLPTLPREVKDGWGRPPVYVAPTTPEGTPRVFSVGPDGIDGTPDDVPAEITADAAIVPLGASLAAYRVPDLKDASGREPRVQMRDAVRWEWEVSTPGPDGTWGTPDDVVGGNTKDVGEFFGRPSVKPDFVDPARRRLRVLVIHLPLVPDDVMRRMWEAEAMKSHRPDENAAFTAFRKYRTDFYLADDPKDPEKGHGAALAKRVAPDAPKFLVPDPSIFGPAPADLGKDDPARKDYVEKGWREIVLREYFFEHVLNEALKAALESRRKHKEWEEKKAGEEPTVLTFEKIVEDSFKPYLGGGDTPFLKLIDTKDQGLTREELEKHVDVGDVNLTVNLSSVTEKAQLYTIPLPLHGRLTRTLIENVEFVGERQRELDEVRKDEVFLGRYLEYRRLERARKELDALRKLVDEKEAAAGADAAAKEKAFDAALAEWSAKNGAVYVVETTGPFLGADPPPSASIPEGVPADEAARMRRKQFVWSNGYMTVRRLKGDEGSPAPGTWGRYVVPDTSRGEDATNSAYLIRVVSSKAPGPEEFSPAHYAEVAASAYYGMDRRDERGPIHTRSGHLSRTLGKFLDDPAYLKERFELDTSVDLKSQAKEER